MSRLERVWILIALVTTLVLLFVQLFETGHP